MIYFQMSQLAAKHGAINLGQGSPGLPPPAAVIDSARAAMDTDNHQYTNPRGSLPLRRAIANHANRRYGTSLDPESDVVVSSGAQDALGSAFLGLLEPGDEILFIEPFYNPCIPMARMTGATLRYLSLEPPEFRLTEERIAAAVNDRTKLVVYNSPNNPSGRILSREELTMLCEACERHDAYIIADEVYEYYTYDGRPHVSILELEDYRHRTAAVGSLGKTFLLTGWRVGWAAGAKDLIGAMGVVHQLIAYCLPGFLMEGARFALEDLPPSYFEWLTSTHQAKRDLLVEGLTSKGVRVALPEGTFFLAVDISSFGEEDDLKLCHRLPEEAGVSAIPMSLSWDGRREARHYIRLCYSKSDEELREAVQRFGRWLDRR
jgi:aspartate/methionine/tyrosine aminotransferase